MRHSIKAAIVAFLGFGALATTASAQPYDQDYYGDQYAQDPYAQDAYAQDPYDMAYADSYYGSEYGYCDPQYGCPDDFYDLPLYYGEVYADGSWYNGPFYWCDYGGRRQFWVHGSWRGGNYRGGRFGRALGRSFYSQHRYAGRGGVKPRGRWGGGRAPEFFPPPVSKKNRQTLGKKPPHSA